MPRFLQTAEWNSASSERAKAIPSALTTVRGSPPHLQRHRGGERLPIKHIEHLTPDREIVLYCNDRMRLAWSPVAHTSIGLAFSPPPAMPVRISAVSTGMASMREEQRRLSDGCTASIPRRLRGRRRSSLRRSGQLSRARVAFGSDERNEKGSGAWRLAAADDPESALPDGDVPTHGWHDPGPRWRRKMNCAAPRRDQPRMMITTRCRRPDFPEPTIF